MYNANNKDDVEERKLKIKREREIYIDALKNILKTKDGYKVLFTILDRGYVFHKTMTGNSETFFNEGLRACANELWKDIIKANPKISSEIFMEAMKED